MRYVLLILTILVLSRASQSAVGSSDHVKPRACTHRDADDARNLPVSEISSDQLPKAVYIAASADFFLSKKASASPLFHQQQSFTEASTSVVCANLDESLPSINFSVLAPTLIDLRPSQVLQDKFWNFQSFLSKKRAGAWNQPNGLMSQLTFEDWANDRTKKVRIFRVHAKAYMIELRETKGQFVQKLLIKYDLAE